MAYTPLLTPTCEMLVLILVGDDEIFKSGGGWFTPTGCVFFTPAPDVAAIEFRQEKMIERVTSLSR